MNPIASAPLQRRAESRFFHRSLLPTLVLLAAGLGPRPAAAQATKFKFLVPPSSPAALYTTSPGSNAITIEVQAQTAGGVVFPGFNHNVVAGLYSTATGLVSDPQAVYQNAGTTFIGSMPLSWVNGTAGFSVTFEAGSDSEQIVLQDLSAGPVTVGTTYPGSLGVTTGAAMTVRGFQSQPLFPRNFHFNGVSENPPTDDTPFTYTVGGSTDNLATNDSTVTFFGPGDYGDLVPHAGGVTGGSGIDTNAACYLIQNFNGGYAAGGAGVSVRLWFSDSIGTAPVSYQVILDYDGSLTDYNNPDPSKDTVLKGAVTCGVGYGFFTTAPTTLAGYQPYQPFMLGNGQVIFRVWTVPGKSVTMKYANANVFPTDDNSISFIKIPYSSLNIQPLRSTVTAPSYTGTPPTPPYVLAGSNTTLIDTFTNQYSSGLTQVIFQIPADPLGATNWVISSVPAPTGPNPGSSTGILQPSGTTAGAVTVNFNPSNPFATNEILPVTINGQAPATNYSWPLSILSATSNTGSNVPIDSTSVAVNTLEAPDKPGSFSAQPANYAGPGGQISLSWSQSVSQSPLGYVISRSPGAASGNPFGDPVTLPSGLVVNNAITLVPSGTVGYLDTGVANLTGYTYSIQSFNNVTQSAIASVGPVTPFANPAPPTSVTALTGGSNIQLNWAAPASVAGSYAVTGYQIYRGTSPGGENASPIASVAGLTYNDPGLAAGTNYYYYLSSMDNQYSGGPTFGAHDSGPSAEVTGFPPGNPPNNVGVTLAVIGPPATLAVTWSAPVSDLNAIANYYIWKETDSGGFGASAFATVGSAAVSVWDGNVTTGHTYSYFVQAVDSLSNVSNNSATVLGQVGPSAPVSLLAVGYASSVTLTWNSNPSAESVTGYCIKSNGSPLTVVPAPGSGLVTGFDTTPVQGTNYGYQVAGINNTGVTGTYCAAVTSALLPLVPQSFAVTVQQTGVSFNMDLNWTAPLSSGNVTAYNVRYNTTNNFGTSTFIGSLPFVPQPYVFNQPLASAGTTFFFWIRAVDPGGVGPTTEVGLQAPPNPPTGLAFASTPATITLNWTARPASENVSLYTIYRSTSPTSGFASIGASATASYADGGAAANTDYYYEVTATNPGGGGVTIPGGESLFSASVTAALAPAVPVGLTATLVPASDNVNLSWTSQTGSDPILQSYVLSRTINGGAPTVLQTAPASTTSFSDTGITSANAGATILYYLAAINNAGVTGASEGPIGLQVPPNPPVLLPASPSSVAVTVNWTANPAAENVSQYTIYRSALPAGVPAAIATVTPGTANSYPDLGPLSQGVTYAYFITATNPGGGVGVPGGTSSASSTINSGLGAPVPSGPGIASLDTSNNIGVTWTNVTLTVPNATAVSLLINNTNNPATASATQLAATAVTFYDNGVFSASVTGEQPDTTYYYWLETLNTFGPSSASLPASQLTYPAAVTTVSAVLDADGVSRDLTWDTVGAGDVASYNIYREQIGGSGFVSVGSVSATGLAFPVKRTSPVLPGKLYAYEITAVNATGEGTSYNAVTVGVPPSDPSPVTAVSGLATTPEVSLTWPANPLGESVTGYSVYRGTTPNWSAATSISSGAVTTYLDNSGLSGGTTYYYWVEAQDGDGVYSLPTSLTSSVTIAAAAQPNAPTGVLETDGNASAGLTWTSAVSTTFPIVGYNLYDSPNGGATVKANATPVAAPPSVVSGLTNGVSYNLWVQAVDSHGNLSPLSPPVLGLPDAPPGVPGGVSASSGNNETQVTWNPSTAGTLPIGSYLVEKIAAGVTTTIPVPGNQTGYVDNSAVNGNAYTYLVEAVDGTGVTTGSHVSGYSSAVTVTAGLITVNPPSQLTAIGGVNLVKLSWTDSAGGSPVTGYQVFRAETAPSATGYSLLTSTATGTSPLTDATAANGNTYGYYFVAYSSGVASANSATIFATAAAPPSAPATVSLLDGGQEDLSWTPSPGQGAVTISDYYIVSSVNGGAAATLASTTGPVTTYTDGTPSIGQTVVYQVGAVNSNGTTGALSAAVTGYLYTPMTITGLTSTDSTSAVTLNWVGPGTVTWAPVQYDILRTTLTGGSPATFISVAPSYTDSSGTLGQVYLYTVTAVDAKNHASVGGGPVTDGPLNPPAAPATVVATAGNQQILFDWAPSAPVSDSLPVSFYLVSLNGGAPVTLPATQTSYLDSGLLNGSAVTAVVQAIDATGNPVGNHLSAAVTGGPATTSGALLNPPTGAAVTATSPSTNLLTWVRPNDEGYIVTGYNIYRSTSFTTVLGSPIATIANPALNPVTVFNDSGLSPNTTYFYVITANYQQGVGVVASPPSNHAWDTTPAPQAGVPPVTPGQMAFDANLLKPLTGQVLNIYFIAPNSGPAEFDIYNVSGNPIRALYATSVAGKQESLAWDGKDRNGNTVASGIYLVEIKGPGIHLVRKVLVVK